MTYIVSAVLVMSGFIIATQLTYLRFYDWRIACPGSRSAT